MSVVTSVKDGAELDAAISGKSGLVLLFFTSSWSESSKAAESDFRKAVESLDGIKGYIIDVDVLTDIASTYDARMVPSLVLLKNRKTLEGLAGDASEESIKDLIERYQ
jgi:thioredoxin-like negative regulator of GroEL